MRIRGLKQISIRSINLLWLLNMAAVALLLIYPVVANALEEEERVTEIAELDSPHWSIQATSTKEKKEDKKELEKEVVQATEFRPDNVTLYQICSCESGNGKYGTPQQFEADGVTPLVGRLTPEHLGKDIGMCQINTMYHLDTATSLGYDIYTAEGNWGYAQYLYKNQGTKPWEASRSCWE